MANVKFFFGEQSAYDRATPLDSGLYFITDRRRIYRGTTLIADANVQFTTDAPTASNTEPGILYVYTDSAGQTSTWVNPGSGSGPVQVGGGEADAVADGILTVGNFAEGTVATSISSDPSAASDSKIPTEKAVSNLVNTVKEALSTQISQLEESSGNAIVDVSAGPSSAAGKFNLNFYKASDTAKENPIVVELDKEQYLQDVTVVEKQEGEPPTTVQYLVFTIEVFDGEGNKTTRDIEIKLSEILKVDASTVKTTSTITVTTPVGNYTAGQTIPVSDLQSVLMNMLSQDKWMGSNEPSVGGSLSLTSSAEVGTKVTPSYNVNFVQGSYNADEGSVKAQPSPDCSVTSWTASFTGQENKTSTSGTSFSGSFSETVAEESAKTLKVVVNYGKAANGPFTFLGNTSYDGKTSETEKIQQGSASKSATLKGYRQGYFWGMLTTTSAGVPLDSEVIREVANNTTSNVGRFKGSAYSKGTIGTASSPVIKAENLEGVKRIFVACPATNTGVTNVIMPSASNYDATKDFVKLSTPVSIEGADGYTGINYNVWVYEPAVISSDQTFVVTLG